ncbi:MAG: polyprenyl synthetase family protein [Sulfobacillus sp.]
MDIDAWLSDTRALIEHWIEEDMPQTAIDKGSVEDAMRYAVLAGGKRLRPQLVLASAVYLGQPMENFRDAALAVEYLHTYSLIHDDLPAMDNDDWRRGHLTAHKVYGEAMAILAGDALLTEAFAKLAHPDWMDRFNPSRVLLAVRRVALAAGRQGLIEGQVKDLAAEGRQLELEQLEEIHRKKTGALIVACVQLPSVMVGDAQAEARLTEFGKHFGLAFQIVDDILNEIGDAQVMGKATGTDRALGKATYPAILGMEASRALAEHHRTLAKAALETGARSGILRSLIDFAVDRQW